MKRPPHFLIQSSEIAIPRGRGWSSDSPACGIAEILWPTGGERDARPHPSPLPRGEGDPLRSCGKFRSTLLRSPVFSILAARHYPQKQRRSSRKRGECFSLSSGERAGVRAGAPSSHSLLAGTMHLAERRVSRGSRQDRPKATFPTLNFSPSFSDPVRARTKLTAPRLYAPSRVKRGAPTAWFQLSPTPFH